MLDCKTDKVQDGMLSNLQMQPYGEYQRQILE